MLRDKQSQIDRLRTKLQSRKQSAKQLSSIYRQKERRLHDETLGPAVSSSAAAVSSPGGNDGFSEDLSESSLSRRGRDGTPRTPSAKVDRELQKWVDGAVLGSGADLSPPGPVKPVVEEDKGSFVDADGVSFSFSWSSPRVGVEGGFELLSFWSVKLADTCRDQTTERQGQFQRCDTRADASCLLCCLSSPPVQRYSTRGTTGAHGVLY